MSCAYVREFGITRGDGEIFAHLGNAILCTQPLDDVVAVAMAESAHAAAVPEIALAVRADWHADRVLCERTIRPRNDHARRGASE